jgi:hypothetical protein
MIRTILAIRAPSEEDKRRVAESLASLKGVLAADIAGDEAVVHHSAEIDDGALVDMVYRCEGCTAQVICDEDE